MLNQTDDWLAVLVQQMRDDIENSAAPRRQTLTVAEFLGKFGYRRRTVGIVSHIRNRLEESGLRTMPDFEFAYRDAAILVEPNSATPEAIPGNELSDPTHRIGALEAANNPPLNVHPDSPLSAATTIMQMHDFSQLPVLANERTVRGIISWKSIGTRLSLGRQCEFVRECMEPPVDTPIDSPLFEAIAIIAEHGYVLVRGANQVITGIVTASDVSQQFMQLAGPFLLIGEIEGHLRHLIHGKFTVDEMKGQLPDSDGGRTINGSADLTLAGYCRLLEAPEHWDKLELNIDRVEFVKHLDDVRKTRNDVMHFDPDGLVPEDTKKLRDVARFFEDMVRMGVV